MNFKLGRYGCKAKTVLLEFPHLKDKLKTMSDEEQYELLASDGLLVKRPILITADKVLVGFKEEEYQSLR